MYVQKLHEPVALAHNETMQWLLESNRTVNIWWWNMITVVNISFLGRKSSWMETCASPETLHAGTPNRHLTSTVMSGKWTWTRLERLYQLRSLPRPLFPNLHWECLQLQSNWLQLTLNRENGSEVYVSIVWMQKNLPHRSGRIHLARWAASCFVVRLVDFKPEISSETILVYSNKVIISCVLQFCYVNYSK